MVNLNSLFKDIMALTICLNIGTYLVMASGIFPNVAISYTDLGTLSGWFSTNIFDYLLVGGAAGTIGLVSLLTRNGNFAIYATLIAAIGLVLSPIRNAITIIPTLLGQIMPNPLGGGPNPIVVAMQALVAIATFWWLFSMLSQRDT